MDRPIRSTEESARAKAAAESASVREELAELQCPTCGNISIRRKKGGSTTCSAQCERRFRERINRSLSWERDIDLPKT